MSLSLRFWAGHEASTTRGQQAGGVGMDLGKVMLIAYIPVPIFVFFDNMKYIVIFKMGYYCYNML